MFQKLLQLLKSVLIVPTTVSLKIVSELTERFRKHYDVIDIDGARINFENGWALIRASNTQPVLVLRFEADNIDQLKKIISLVRDAMSKYESDITLDQELY